MTRSMVDRTELGLSPRRCLVCGRPAKECARSRTHSVEDLQNCTKQILVNAIEEADVRDTARLAVRALLYEVCTTPKPGLVDRSNSGSHKDMDIFTFMDSACALFPYFESCTRIGRQTSGLPAAETFLRLRPAGKKAEADMFSATKGINTHKGAIFSVGILCAALGRLPRDQWRMPERILKECAAMTQGLTASDFAGLTEETAVTTGQKLYLHYQITGIRGQVEAGFPAVQYTGLPILKEGLARGLSINDAGCAALLALMASATDTNLIARSDVVTQQKTVENIKEVLARTPYPDKQILEQLDRNFIEKNLSPGGSADLLAICYFLYFLESEE
ncbi:MAG: triphosphoribosyl-dephospho-CoA synthase CitG [Eubacteriales bacterium]|nr:triphosphoribosyl-dephospho-CoA synthase CitG [Eubacteriales bacterium]